MPLLADGNGIGWTTLITELGIPDPMLITPRAINEFFERFVRKPFHGHEKTIGWKEEVLSRPDDWAHRTNNILERGLADFDAPYKNLTVDEKVTIYCYQYMQKHSASTYYVFDVGTKVGLTGVEDWILLDFGYGPATLVVALAWLRARDSSSAPDRSTRPLLNYIGIERCRAMREKGRSITRDSDLFHRDSKFRFRKSFDDAKEIFSDIDAVEEDEVSSLVLNFSYFFSSKFLNVRDVVTFVDKVRTRYTQYPIWLVYQNPAHSDFRSPWEKFKRETRGFRSIKSSSEKVGYPNTTNKGGKVDVFNVDYELMLHRPS